MRDSTSTMLAVRAVWVGAKQGGYFVSLRLHGVSDVLRRLCSCQLSWDLGQILLFTLAWICELAVADLAQGIKQGQRSPEARRSFGSPGEGALEGAPFPAEREVSVCFSQWASPASHRPWPDRSWSTETHEQPRCTWSLSTGFPCSEKKRVGARCLVLLFFFSFLGKGALLWLCSSFIAVGNSVDNRRHHGRIHDRYVHDRKKGGGVGRGMGPTAPLLLLVLLVTDQINTRRLHRWRLENYELRVRVPSAPGMISFGSDWSANFSANLLRSRPMQEVPLSLLVVSIRWSWCRL